MVISTLLYQVNIRITINYCLIILVTQKNTEPVQRTWVKEAII